MEEYSRSVIQLSRLRSANSYGLETNIMVGTHADSLITEAVVKGFGKGFNMSLAYEAVHKDATVPPENDSTTQ